MSNNIIIPNLSDQTYFSISGYTYDYHVLEKFHEDGLPLKITVKKGVQEYWFIDRVERDPYTGLDAFVFSQGEKVDGKWVKSEKPKNVVVGFAGTDTKQVGTDVLTSDGKHVVLGINPKVPTLYIKKKNSDTLIKYTGSPGQEAFLLNDDYKLIKKDTAFEQSNKLVAEVKAEYKHSVVSTTGHSLGEAEAEYAGIHNGVFSFGFNGPSITNLYTKEIKKRIYNGEFENTAINLVDPYDAVGAGWGTEYERHGGTTYYTHNPLMDRKLRADNLKRGAVFGVSGIIGNTLNYLIDTAVSKDGTHSLNSQNFAFDEYGNAINTDPSQNVKYLYNRNKEEYVFGTPLASSSGGTIKLDMASIQEMVRMIQEKYEMMKEFEMKIAQFEHVHNQTVEEIIRDFNSKLSGEFHLLSQADVREAIDDLSLAQNVGMPAFFKESDLNQSVESMQRVLRDLSDIQSLFESIASQFEEKDQLLANWILH